VLRPGGSPLTRTALGHGHGTRGGPEQAHGDAAEQERWSGPGAATGSIVVHVLEPAAGRPWPPSVPAPISAGASLYPVREERPTAAAAEHGAHPRDLHAVAPKDGCRARCLRRPGAAKLATAAGRWIEKVGRIPAGTHR